MHCLQTSFIMFRLKGESSLQFGAVVQFNPSLPLQMVLWRYRWVSWPPLQFTTYFWGTCWTGHCKMYLSLSLIYLTAQDAFKNQLWPWWGRVMEMARISYSNRTLLQIQAWLMSITDTWGDLHKVSIIQKEYKLHRLYTEGGKGAYISCLDNNLHPFRKKKQGPWFSARVKSEQREGLQSKNGLAVEN